MGKNLLKKAGLIGMVPPAAPGVLNRSTPAPEAPKPKTAPGTMMGFMTAQSGAIQEAERLREQLEQYQGSTPVKALDPKAVVPSKWANRHPATFVGAEFEALKEEIAEAGGNVQPIKVRPRVLNGSTPGEPAYEIVFGHRRHRACLELGLPVRALIEDASDAELFEQMERENRGRKNLSAWEQGCMYRQAIDEGLYPSMRRLAEAVGVDLSLVSKSIALARLPDEVVEAFASPLEVQYRWAQPLADVQQKDPEGLLARARQVKTVTPPLAAARVLAVLLGQEVLNRSTPDANRAPVVIRQGKKRLATVLTDAKGRAIVRFEPGAVPESRRPALAKLIEGFLAEAPEPARPAKPTPAGKAVK